MDVKQNNFVKENKKPVIARYYISLNISKIFLVAAIKTQPEFKNLSQQNIEISPFSLRNKEASLKVHRWLGESKLSMI